MAEYIDREKLCDLIERWREVRTNPYSERDNILIEAMLYAIHSAPVADVASIVSGCWIKDEASYYPDDYYCVYHDYECSNCGETVNDRHRLPKYCPECGSRNEVKK